MTMYMDHADGKEHQRHTSVRHGTRTFESYVPEQLRESYKQQYEHHPGNQLDRSAAFRMLSSQPCPRERGSCERVQREADLKKCV